MAGYEEHRQRSKAAVQETLARLRPDIDSLIGWMETDRDTSDTDLAAAGRARDAIRALHGRLVPAVAPVVGSVPSRVVVLPIDGAGEVGEL